MSNLDFSAMARNTQNRSGASKSERPKAKVWFNIGDWFDYEDENGNVESIFISPFGVPMDWLEPEAPYTGSNPRMLFMNQVKIALQEQFLAECQAVEQGDTTPVTGFKGQIRRVGSVKAQTKETSEALSEVVGRIKFG